MGLATQTGMLIDSVWFYLLGLPIIYQVVISVFTVILFLYIMQRIPRGQVS